MNALVRPSHYGAFHFIWPTRVPPDLVPPRRTESPDLPGLAPADVVGPICESGDFLALDRSLPQVTPGALLAVFGAGAYGISMASRYNAMPLPPEVLVDADRATLIRRRETYEDLVAHEREPEPVAIRPEWGA
jgi:diaminopimelate decarboxylase